MPFQSRPAGAEEALAAFGAISSVLDALDILLAAAESDAAAVDDWSADALGLASSALATFASLGADETVSWV